MVLREDVCNDAENGRWDEIRNDVVRYTLESSSKPTAILTKEQMNDMEWVIPQKPTQEVKNSLLPFGQIEQQILYNRGYWTEASASAFLNPEVSLEADPFLINEMENAVERVFDGYDHEITDIRDGLDSISVDVSLPLKQFLV